MEVSMKNTMFKKTAAAIIGASMLASLFTPAMAANSASDAKNVSFSDINEAQYKWAQPYIIDMAKKGYITGYEDDTFRPDNEVTRLECLALFSRAMGALDEVNEPILEMAHDEYDSMLTRYSLPWGKDEIVYMLYKGALQKTDLDTYLEGTEKNKAMKRSEAAIIITKAMGGEKDALSDLGIALSYADANEIPANAIQYVQYVTGAGIMQGMDDNKFSPGTPVLRSQMSVMLSRAVSKTAYSFKRVKLTEVDAAIREIAITDPEGQELSYVYTDDTAMRELGELVMPKDITAGVQAVITLSDDTLVAVDTLTSVPDATVTGQYKSISSSNGTVRVRIIPTGEKEAKQYECSSDVSVTFDGSPATMRSFKDGDSITLEVVGGKVVTVKGETKVTTVSGAKIESLDVDEDVRITISHADKEYDGKTYIVSDNVAVTKNGKTSDLRSIYTGDTVNLTLEYGEIKKIAAVSKTSTVEGTIQAITISATPSMTVKVDGREQVYDVNAEVEIIINEAEGKLSDFKVGDTVKITTESNTVTKIVATSVQDLSGSAVGVISGVNNSYKVITLRKDNGEVMQFQCPDSNKNSTKYISLADGVMKKLSDIKEDQTVEVKYSVSNGVYIATLVIILSE